MSRILSLRAVLGLMLAAALLAVGSVFLASDFIYSPELSVEEYSPLGEEGGAVIPASCPSYAHTTGQCTPPDFNGSGDGGNGATIYINNGDSATLTWSCPSAYNTSSSGTNFSTGGALSGSTSVSPTSNTTYTIVCNDSGSSGQVAVTVLNPVLSISASPTRVRQGNASTITWSASEVDSCSVSGPSFSASGLSGSQSSGAIQNESTYTLTCSTEGGDESASVTVTLAPSFEEI